MTLSEMSMRALSTNSPLSNKFECDGHRSVLDVDEARVNRCFQERLRGWYRWQGLGRGREERGYVPKRDDTRGALGRGDEEPFALHEADPSNGPFPVECSEFDGIVLRGTELILESHGMQS